MHSPEAGGSLTRREREGALAGEMRTAESTKTQSQSEKQQLERKTSLVSMTGRGADVGGFESAIVFAAEAGQDCGGKNRPCGSRLERLASGG
jgi:hypothetical protein